MTHWDMLNKENSNLLALFNMSQCGICSLVWQFWTKRSLSCKGPIPFQKGIARTLKLFMLSTIVIALKILPMVVLFKLMATAFAIRLSLNSIHPSVKRFLPLPPYFFLFFVAASPVEEKSRHLIWKGNLKSYYGELFENLTWAKQAA